MRHRIVARRRSPVRLRRGVLVLALAVVASDAARAQEPATDDRPLPLTPDPTLPTFKPVQEPPRRAYVPTRWPAIYTLPFHYFSIDSRPIEVTLRHSNDPDHSHSVILKIPVAYIVYVTGYSQQKLPRLPDCLETNYIELALTYPEGKALSIHAYEMGSERHPGSDRRIGFEAAAKSLRAQQYAVQLNYVRPDIPWEERVRQPPKFMSEAGTYDGMTYIAGNTRRDNYLGEEGRDEFVRVSCALKAEARPYYFCETTFRVAGDLVARADFVDFRFNGGREFLNERVRVLRQALCRFFEDRCSASGSPP